MKAKTGAVFYTKTDATMHLEIGPDGWVLAERDRVLRVKDTDGDGAGDVEGRPGDARHSVRLPAQRTLGMAWHPDGGLVFWLGERLRQGLDAHVKGRRASWWAAARAECFAVARRRGCGASLAASGTPRSDRAG